MKEEEKLINKINHHLRLAGVPKWFHHFGPEKYVTAHLVLGLAVREAYSLSYRASACFLDEYYSLKLHWTTLQKAAARLPLRLWQRVLSVTSVDFCFMGAIDSTGFSTNNPSVHYLRRIDGKMPKVPVKLSLLVDVDSRKILSSRIRTRPAHDVKDVKSLIRQSPIKPFTLLMDKAYDSEPLHKHLEQQGIRSIAPTRENCRRGKNRKRLRKNFPNQEYAYRNIIESVIKSVKTRFSGRVRGRKAATIKTEVSLKLILHNLTKTIKRHFLQTRVIRINIKEEAFSCVKCRS